MSQAHNPDLTTMRRLRRGIGAIGLGLPFALLFGVLISGAPLENSISEFFFSPLRDVFVMAAAGVGLFLLAYEGYPPKGNEILTDRRVSSLAGISVLIMASVPAQCLRGDCYQPLTLFDQLIHAQQLQSAIHLVAAGIFLISLGVMSLRLFTLCNHPNQSLFKHRRNQCYRIFAWMIFAMVTLIAVMKLVFVELGQAWDARWHFTFWAESVAVWAFGLSWLLKGEALHSNLTFLYGAKPE